MDSNIHHVRNLAVIAHVDHGKTTLSDSLVARAHLMREDQAGSACVLDFDEEEKARGITISSTGITLVYPDFVPYIADSAPSPTTIPSSVSVSPATSENENESEENSVPTLYLGNLPWSLADHKDGGDEAIRAALVTLGVTPVDVQVRGRRGFASCTLQDNAAVDMLLRASPLRLFDRDVVVSIYGEGPQQRLAHLCKQRGLNMPVYHTMPASTDNNVLVSVSVQDDQDRETLRFFSNNSVCSSLKEARRSAATHALSVLEPPAEPAEKSQATPLIASSAQPKAPSEIKFVVNLIDSPGHIDFNSEVSAALRITDGALVVVDAVEGVAVQTETVLRQALAERVRPVLVINKCDRLIQELQLTPDQTYTRFLETIAAVNQIISTYQDPELGDLTVDPAQGTVCFAAAKQGWSFSLDTYAHMFIRKAPHLKPEEVRRRLWKREHFVNRVLQPVFDVYQLVDKAVLRNDDSAALQQLYDNIVVKGGVTTLKMNAMEHALNEDATGKALLKLVMRRWLPLAEALLNMAYMHLPSPVEAQKIRVDTLYDGPLDDECATAIRNCDPHGPLMVYVSKLVPNSESQRQKAGAGGKFVCFGRIFSGTVSIGQQVRILGPDYDASVEDVAARKDCYEGRVQGVLVFMGKNQDKVESLSCGNIVGLTGLDKNLLKSGTITTSKNAHRMKTMRLRVSPVVRIAVEAERPSDLPKLVEALGRLAKSDPLVLCPPASENNGEHIVAGAGELHLEIALKKLALFCGVPIRTGTPVVQYKEGVSTETESIVALAKSANKLNRIFVKCRALPESLVTAIEEGSIVWPPKGAEAVVALQRTLMDTHGLDPEIARRVMCITTASDNGERGATNMLVDGTHGVQQMASIRDSLIAAFRWVCREGPLAEEAMRGVLFIITDAMVHSDSSHRGGPQIIGAARRAMYGAFMSAAPVLHEPVFQVSMQVPDDCLGAVYSTLNTRRGRITSNVYKILHQVTANLPVSESFGFFGALRGATSGRAFMQAQFDHWAPVPGAADAQDGSLAATACAKIRVRKGRAAAVPDASTYIDRL